MRYINLSEDEINEIERIYHRTESRLERRRCIFLLLSVQGMSIIEIAKEVKVSWHTVHRFFNRWEAVAGYRISLLQISSGRGRKHKLSEFPMIAIIRRLLNDNDRNLDIVLKELKDNHSTQVCEKTLRNFIRYYNL